MAVAPLRNQRMRSLVWAPTDRGGLTSRRTHFPFVAAWGTAWATPQYESSGAPLDLVTISNSPGQYFGLLFGSIPVSNAARKITRFGNGSVERGMSGSSSNKIMSSRY